MLQIIRLEERKMPRYVKKIWSGDIYECEEYFSPRTIGKDYERGRNENMTPEEQKTVNERQARKKLARLINANFGEGDIFITLTHKFRVNYADAKRELAKYLRRVRDWRRKNGLPELKYIAVTENRDKREHHHVVMSGMDARIAMALWEQGRSMVSQLERGGEYTGLATYITKEPPETNRKRWSQSRNLTLPRVTVQRVGGKSKRKSMPPKGYRVTERYEFYTAMSGEVRYMRAVRDGGEDWAVGRGGCEDEEEMLE